MKRHFLLLMAGALAVALPQATHAWPSGPSAKEAARLKVNPPHNWLEHYLPDDRYKVAGGVWKVVTTELDTYYHKPNCPNMLKQSPDRVLGFASPKDAEEGGYRPDPTCGAAALSASVDAAGMVYAMEISPGLYRLSDGVSTIKLPSNWSHAQGMGVAKPGQKFSQDVLMSRSGERVMIMTLPIPPEHRQEIKTGLNAAGWKQYLKASSNTRKSLRQSIRNNAVIGSSQGVDIVNTFTDYEKNWNVTDWKAGAAKGVKMLVTGKGLTGQFRGMYFATVGDKMVWVLDASGGKTGSDKMIQSLQIR